MFIFHKVTDRFSEILIKIPKAFFEVIFKNPKICVESQKTQITKAILRNKNEARGITLPNFNYTTKL